MNPNKLTPGYNLMWESSRMMLPEHRELLLDKRRKEREFRQSKLSDDQLDEINRIILQSINEDRAITITYASAYEKKHFWGWVTQVKQHQLKIINDEDAITIPYQQIISVELSY
ncbi:MULTISPECIES: YolD-like family protein [Bacillus]|uniref:YolD-like family protein n=1 Tax=Bacillus TaxID=1386 RepID=UPI00165B3943|nr:MULTISPECIES: YolD-like family protein [Bacillus subtilis group]MCY8203421.1 YolD-like family protein [Bacillus sp. N12A5]MCY8104004.1 YolD-like family protein [Bacillus mojavensis]MCY8981397.1 YolD-like family protein [Bacillus halotolerans]MEC1423322.1 YolD-like family protein [Bacillus subtilis]MEC1580098.1 YolD-like family protein [Bacillus subtilis]